MPIWQNRWAISIYYLAQTRLENAANERLFDADCVYGSASIYLSKIAFLANPLENSFPPSGNKLSCWHHHCEMDAMQTQINQLFSSISPDTFGVTDPTSLTVLALVGPGAAMFVILFFGRELLRPRWRGYWDAV